MARRCFCKTKDQSVKTHQTTANNPEIPQTTLFIYHFTSNHLLYLFFYSKLLCLFIISSGMGYQRCLTAQYNEHPHSLIWVFATVQRKWNMGRSGLLQKKKLNETLGDAQETSDQQSYRSACACLCICPVWSRSVFFILEKRLTWNKGLCPRKHMTTKVPDQHVHSDHYENMPIQIYWKFYHQKLKIFR